MDLLCGVIDIGSNTVRLSIYEYDGNQIKPIINKKFMLGLISYVENGKLSDKGIEKLCETLLLFKYTALNFHINELYLFATASLRNISNTEKVLLQVLNETDYQIDVISGVREAQLDFYGAINQDNVINNGLLVDIGGGSTELVVFKNKEIIKSNSYPIGSLNMFDNYVKKLFPTQISISQIKDKVEECLDSFTIEKKYDLKYLFGVGGTIRGAFKLYNEIYDNKETQTQMQADTISDIITKISKNKRSTLKLILKAVPDRIHTIIPGLVILETVIKYYKCKTLKMSSFGVREGYLMNKLENNKL